MQTSNLSSNYTRRVVDDELDELLGGLPAIALEGAKGVGKTGTAAERANTALRFDSAADRTLFAAEPALILERPRPVLLDEWQLLAESWDVVRRAVDDGAPPGSFLLTGSAIPAGATTHSGAGRIVSVRLRPMTLAERGVEAPTVSFRSLLSGTRPAVAGSTAVGLARYADEIVASGFPGLRTVEGRALRAQLDGYVSRIVERELPENGRVVRNPAALRRWLAAYAAASSTTASYETIRDAATGGEGEKPSKRATIPYRDALERLFVVEPVPAWLPRGARLNRLSSAPKHQLVDPALAAALLGADQGALLEGRPASPAVPRDGVLLGSLFESLVTLSVRVYAQAAEARVGHLRTHSGQREIDLIVERRDGRVLAIETKLTRAPSDDDVRHLRWLQRELGDDLLDAVVVTTGSDAYRRPDGIAVVPAALLGP
mgnify:FL=1